MTRRDRKTRRWVMGAPWGPLEDGEEGDTMVLWRTGRRGRRWRRLRR